MFHGHPGGASRRTRVCTRAQSWPGADAARNHVVHIYDRGPVVHNSGGAHTNEVVVVGLVLPRRNLSVRDNATHKYLTSSLRLRCVGPCAHVKPRCTGTRERSAVFELQRVKVSGPRGAGQKNWRTILALGVCGEYVRYSVGYIPVKVAIYDGQTDFDVRIVW